MRIPRLDWRSLVNETAVWADSIKRRQVECNLDQIVSCYKEYKQVEATHRALLTQRNLLAAANTGGHQPGREQGRELKTEIAEINSRLQLLSTKLHHLCTALPNTIHPAVPEIDTVIDTFNTDTVPGKPVNDHIQAMKQWNWMDPLDAVRVAGRGVSVLRGKAAVLEHALCNYAIRFAVNRGFELVTVPDLVKQEHVESSGFAPRRNDSGDAVFRLPEDGLALAGTAELPLLAMHSSSRLTGLPRLYVARGHAFRREAGQTGQLARGLFRLHQFTKVELFAIADPLSSETVFEQLCSVQLDLIRSLGLPGRRLEMSAKELGASAHRKRDIELWFPGMQRFGEVTSASNCTDYQARRADIRVGNRFVHTLNATGMAIPRIIQCIVEWGGNIPECLKSDMDHLTI